MFKAALQGNRSTQNIWGCISTRQDFILLHNGQTPLCSLKHTKYTSSYLLKSPYIWKCERLSVTNTNAQGSPLLPCLSPRFSLSTSGLQPLVHILKNRPGWALLDMGPETVFLKRNYSTGLMMENPELPPQKQAAFTDRQECSTSLVRNAKMDTHEVSHL